MFLLYLTFQCSKLGIVSVSKYKLSFYGSQNSSKHQCLTREEASVLKYIDKMIRDIIYLIVVCSGLFSTLYNLSH